MDDPPPTPELPEEPGTGRLKRLLFGEPRKLGDPTIFHRMSLVAFLAWVGLGADGLSSSCYGPEEAMRALGDHRHLAWVLAGAMALTVFVISWSYSRIIEAFPSGGGGYVVPFKVLGPTAGAVSGSALMVDYVLTIAISVAAAVDAVFSSLPADWGALKVPVGVLVIFLLMVLNLRGVKESVTILAPIFLVFLITHAVVLAIGLIGSVPEVSAIAAETEDAFRSDLAQEGGLVIMLLVLLRAYSLGGGTYTGIEAVANSTNIMREPVVRTAKRTMLYMSISLAITAAGILICYVLLDVEHEEGRTMNAVLIERVSSSWNIGSWPVGKWFSVVTLASEAALLFVAAQAGFIAGPRVMASMAVDSWLPHRFAALSDRLTMHNGIWLMAIAALVVLVETGAKVSHLVVLYSINVFLTFSLANISMCVRSVRSLREGGHGKRDLGIHGLAATMCVGILVVTIVEKFEEGGWMTLVVTGLVFGLCLLIREHYAQVKGRLRRLETSLSDLPDTGEVPPPLDPSQPTAVLLVESYGGVGVHQLLSIFRFFPGYFRNVVFVSIGVIDSGNFKGASQLEALEEATEAMLARYVELARKLGVSATSEWHLGTDVVSEAERACESVGRRYPRHMFFGGKLVFERERWYERFLHNETAFTIQRRLAWNGHPMTVLPVRVQD